MFDKPQTYADDSGTSYFEDWLSSGLDIWSYYFVDSDSEYDDWVDVRAPIPTLDCIHNKNNKHCT